MISFEFTTSQVEELKKHYKEELDNLLKKAVEVQGLIDKLNIHPSPQAVSARNIHDLISSARSSEGIGLVKKRGRKPKVAVGDTDANYPKPEVTKKSKEVNNENDKDKRNKWQGVIVSVLQEKGKPMKKAEILKEVLKRTQLRKSNSIDRAVQMSIQRLKTVKKQITSEKTVRHGKKGTFYSLINTENPPAKKRGRKPNPVNETKAVAKVAKTKVAKVAKTKVVKEAKVKTVKAGRKPLAKAPVAKAKIQKKEKAVRGPKSIWGNFILDTLKNTNKLLQAKDLVQMALKKFNLPDSKKSSVRLSIAGMLSRGKSIHKFIKTHKKKNVHGAFFGLNEWFAQNGKVKDIYLVK